MQINLKNEQVSKILFYLIPLFVNVFGAQDQSEYRCARYKQLLYEKNTTISYFHPDADEVVLSEDLCKSASGFVVGGANALPKEFPFAARLGNLDTTTGGINWFCGGTIVSPYFILTAAHCFFSPLGIVNRVRLGELDFNSFSDDADPEDYFVHELIEHPEYRPNEPYNDIGLVLLTSAITFNSYKHPACLPPLNLMEEYQTSLIAIGWGHTTFAGHESSHLQKVSIHPYSQADCARFAEDSEGLELLPFGLQNSLLCAGSSEKKDTCQGDSGGPLLTQHPQYPCMHIVIGVTSTGFSGCATPNVPSLYTRVKEYLNWIYFYI